MKKLTFKYASTVSLHVIIEYLHAFKEKGLTSEFCKYNFTATLAFYNPSDSSMVAKYQLCYQLCSLRKTISNRQYGETGKGTRTLAAEKRTYNQLPWHAS